MASLPFLEMFDAETQRKKAERISKRDRRPPCCLKEDNG
jgi:hypothetical protein